MRNRQGGLGASRRARPVRVRVTRIMRRRHLPVGLGVRVRVRNAGRAESESESETSASAGSSGATWASATAGVVLTPSETEVRCARLAPASWTPFKKNDGGRR